MSGGDLFGRIDIERFESCRAEVRAAVQRHNLGLRGHCLERLAVGRAVVGEDQAGREQVEHVAQLAVVAGDQRIGGRDRRDGHADMHAGDEQQQMLDRIARENGDGAILRQSAREKRGGDALHAGDELRVGELAPFAVGAALGDHDRIGRFLRPFKQGRSDGARDVAERVRAARVDDAILVTVDLDILRSELDRALLDRHCPLPQRTLVRSGRRREFCYIV